MNLALELLTAALGLIAVTGIMIQQSHRTQLKLKRVKVRAKSDRL